MVTWGALKCHGGDLCCHEDDLEVAWKPCGSLEWDGVPEGAFEVPCRCHGVPSVYNLGP